MRQNTEQLFEAELPEPQPPSKLLRLREPYWVCEVAPQLLTSSGWELLLPAPLRRARQHRRRQAQIRAMVLRNVENLRWAQLQSLNESFRSFKAAFEGQVNQALSATRDAVAAVLEKKREAGTQAETQELRLTEAAQRLSRLRPS